MKVEIAAYFRNDITLEVFRVLSEICKEFVELRVLNGLGGM
jgi:hypothetical protein